MIPVGLMAAIFWLFARDAPGRPAAVPLGNSFKTLLREPMTWHLALFYFITFGGFVFFANYLPQLLSDWFPANKAEAGLQAAIFTVAATLARPVGGWAADQKGGEKVLFWVFIFIVATRLILAWQATSVNIVIVTDLLLMVGIGFGIGNGAIFKLVPQHFPKSTGLVSGIVGCAGGLGGFLPPLIMGEVKDATGNYALGFVMLAVLAAMGLAILLASSQQRRPSTTVEVDISRSSSAAK
jgi:NNP family nitrate/nitrite transporter-like MFS transporter